MIAFAAAFTLAAGGFPPGALPDGTYRYQIYDSGKPVGGNLLRISRSNGVVKLDEQTALQGDPIETVRTLDPTTFSTLTYAMTTQGVTYHIDVDATGATFRGKTESQHIARAVAGPSMIFDFLAADYAALPAMIRAASAPSFNVYCSCFAGAEVKAATIVTATAERPPSVAATDAAVAFSSDDETATIWYDPATLILHAVDLPKARFRILIQTPPFQVSPKPTS